LLYFENIQVLCKYTGWGGRG